MSWVIEGDSRQLSLGVNKNGLFAIRGVASRHKSLVREDHPSDTVVRRLEAAECRWSIHSNTENEIHLDELNTGFYEKVKQFPDLSVASICFLEGPDRIVATVAMPHQVFEKAFQLFQQVLLNPAAGYVLDFGFSGFRGPDSLQDRPTLQEFLAGPVEGKPYITDEVSLVVHRVDTESRRIT